MPEEKTEEKTEKPKSPKWVKLKPKEIEEKIKELAEQGNSPAQIGLILRDKHAIPSTKSILDKRISQVLEKSQTENLEKNHVEKKIETLKAHFEKNKHDYSAQRSMTKKLWTLNKLKA